MGGKSGAVSAFEAWAEGKISARQFDKYIHAYFHHLDTGDGATASIQTREDGWGISDNPVIGRPQMSEEKRSQIQNLLLEGNTKKFVSAATGINVTTIQIARKKLQELGKLRSRFEK